MTNKFGVGVTEWVDGDILYADDLIDTLADLSWENITRSPGTGNFQGVIAHTASIYSVLHSVTIYLTSDGGATFTSKNTALDTTPRALDG